MKQYTLLSFLLFFSFYSEAQKTYEPLKISDDLISIDGIINQVEWDKALKIDLDYETQPGYNTKPIVETSGYILYSDYHIYLRFDAKTRETVRASVRKRDDFGIFNDDIIGIVIDTYGDGRNNLFIGSNPYGSQMDVRVLNSIMEESRYEISFDLEYESSGSINGNLRFLENILIMNYLLPGRIEIIHV